MRRLIMVFILGAFHLSRAAEPHGLSGEYGFISSAALGPQPEAVIRARVVTMRTSHWLENSAPMPTA